MKKTLTFIFVLVLIQMRYGYAQLLPASRENPWPLTAISPGAWHTGASTLQQISDASMGMAPNNFYVHCWDEGSQYAPSSGGIAWRVTNSGGGIVGLGSIPFTGYDIDVALFVHNDTVKVIAAYFRAGLGYYYDIYRITGGALVPESVSNFLWPAAWYCGGINVDANSENMGIAITWADPGPGVYVRAAGTDAAFGPVFYVPGTANFRDPDIAIGAYAGAYGTARNIYIAEKNGTNIVRVLSMPFDPVRISGTAPVTLEYTYTALPSYHIDVPRIDCPDRFNHKKWTVVLGEVQYAAGTTENIRALVMNRATSVVPSSLLVHSYTTASSYNFIPSLPVLAYFDQADRIQVGWMSRHPSVASGAAGNNGRYLGKMVRDPNGGLPDAPPVSYYYIDSVASNSAHALAFSGQNIHSNFNGLYVAFSQYSTWIPGATTMMYRHKPWSLLGFKPGGSTGIGSVTSSEKEPSVYPNPFTNTLAIRVPVSGLFTITVSGIDGRLLYQYKDKLNAGEPLKFSTGHFSPGLYLVRITSSEQGVDYSSKLVK